MKYSIFRERINNEDIGSYTAYGILVKEHGITLRKISDVGSSFLKVYRLCCRCNRLGVDDKQIDYILEDFCENEIK